MRLPDLSTWLAFNNVKLRLDFRPFGYNTAPDSAR